jgi:hypothetical protein
MFRFLSLGSLELQDGGANAAAKFQRNRNGSFCFRVCVSKISVPSDLEKFRRFHGNFCMFECVYLFHGMFVERDILFYGRGLWDLSILKVLGV